MKVKKISVLLVFVMLFGVCSPALAYRSGSATGDAVAYGVAGGAVAGLSAWGISALSIACPPIGICVGLGAVGCGVYGATVEDKTLTNDVLALTVLGTGAPVTYVIASELGCEDEWMEGAKFVLVAGKDAAKVVGAAFIAYHMTRATKVCADEWKKPDEPTKIADLSY